MKTLDKIDFNEYMEKIGKWFEDNGFNIFIGIGLLLIGIVLVKIIMLIVKRILRKSKKLEPITSSFVCSLIRIILYFLLLFFISQVIGIPAGGFIAIFSVVSLACSLALQDSLGNLFNGMIIISSKPFRKGDNITIKGNTGKVKGISAMYTTIVTPDGKEVIIPNSQIVKNEIVNSDKTGERRIELNFDVAYYSDVIKVKEIIKKVIDEDPRVLKEKSVSINLDKFEDSNIVFSAKCWVRPCDFGGTKNDLKELIYNEFKKNNIVMAYEQLEVRMRSDEEVDVIADYSTLDRSSKYVAPEEDTSIVGRIETSMKEKDKKKEKKEKHKKEKALQAQLEKAEKEKAEKEKSKETK